MQAFALASVVEKLKFQPILLDARRLRRSRRFWPPSPRRIVRASVNYLRAPAKKRPSKLYEHLDNSSEIKRVFVTSDPCRNRKDFEGINQDHDLAAIIVGSDQVWRKSYTADFRHYFLNFLSSEVRLARISYAASFGIAEWQFTRKETEEIRSLLSRFDFISVREDSAKVLLQNEVGISVSHVLDPTLLIDREEYQRVFGRNVARKEKQTLLAYLLDPSDRKSEVVNDVSKALDLTLAEPISANERVRDFHAFSASFISSPCRFITSLSGAGFVITDSFHGCVFCLIFNVPFILIPNHRRGNTRFTSLLGEFNLLNRVLDESNDVFSILEDHIDWSSVNRIRDRRRVESMNFLSKSLHQTIEAP